MPQIIVTAEAPTDAGDGPAMLRERVSVSDLESGHFTRHLVERLQWALEDAQALERIAARTGVSMRELLAEDRAELERVGA
jgi:hypothetical protein